MKWARWWQHDPVVQRRCYHGWMTLVLVHHVITPTTYYGMTHALSTVPSRGTFIILAVSLHISRSLYGPCRSPKEQKLVWNDLTLRARLESFMWRFIRVPRNSAVSVYVRADWIGQALLWYILPNTGVAVFGIDSYCISFKHLTTL